MLRQAAAVPPQRAEAGAFSQAEGRWRPLRGKEPNEAHKLRMIGNILIRGCVLVTVVYVEAATGKTRRCQVPKRPNTPYKTKHYKGWDGLGPQSSSGGHSKMSPNLNARGLGLGGTPLRRRGGHRVSAVAVTGHSRRRNVEVCTSIAVHRLVLHRSAPPTGVADEDKKRGKNNPLE